MRTNEVRSKLTLLTQPRTRILAFAALPKLEAEFTVAIGVVGDTANDSTCGDILTSLNTGRSQVTIDRHILTVADDDASGAVRTSEDPGDGAFEDGIDIGALDSKQVNAIIHVLSTAFVGVETIIAYN